MDLIELIPIIAVALYYIFRPKKKQQQQRQDREESHEPQREQRTLEDILREVMEGPSKPQPKPQPELISIEPEPEEQTVPDAYESYTGVLKDSSKEKESEKKAKLAILKKEEEAKSAEDIVFDLRQAVINDAILNRPYA